MSTVPVASTRRPSLGWLRWAGLLLAAVIAGQVMVVVFGLYGWVAIELLSEEGALASRVRPWLAHGMLGAAIVGSAVALELHRRKVARGVEGDP